MSEGKLHIPPFPVYRPDSNVPYQETMISFSLVPTLCDKCVGSLLNQTPGDAGDGAWGL